LKIFTPVGIAMIAVVIPNAVLATRPEPGGEHVVRPHAEADEPDREPAEDDELIAEQRLSTEHRQDLADDAERGQDQDVDLRVPEQPEHVLPEQRLAAGRRVEEVGPPPAVEQHLEERDRDDRQRERQQELHHQPHPYEHRHPEQRHARGAHVDHRDREVDRAGARRDARDHQAERVERHPDARVRRRVGWIPEPATVRRPAQEPAGIQEQSAEDEDPEREGVQPREGDVPRADHQRDQVVEECRRHRHDEQEDHRHAVHREDLVVLVGVEQRVVGLGELAADQQGFDPADQEERERAEAVEDPDLLVIDRREPAPPAGDRRRTTDHPRAGRNARRGRHIARARSYFRLYR
jgi:hypothetical protein